MNISDLSANELLRRYQRGELSVIEVVEACLRCIEVRNPRINAICTINPNAQEAARASDNQIARGSLLRPLEGVPFVVKDVIQTKGIRTTFGSKLFENYVPSEDSISVERMLNAGAILVAKVNTPEFAHDIYTDNKIFGPTRNPHNPNYTSGGSSGGTAAAIASGMTPIGLGTDLGGSLRVPAAMCGIAALRPSVGRVPVYPAEFGWDTFVAHVHGPMARTVEDIGLLMDVLSGPDDRDPSSLPAQGISFTEAAQARSPLRGRRIAFSVDLNGLIPIEPEVADLATVAVRSFANLGCDIEEACFETQSMFEIITGTRGFGIMARYDQFLEKHKDSMSSHLINQVESARRLTISKLADAERLRTDYWHKYRRFMNRYDYMITPTIGAPAFRIGQPPPTQVGGRLVERYYDVYRFPYAFSLLGVPVIAVPCGITSGGLPVGIQIAGHRHGEAQLLEAASSYVAAHPEFGLFPSKLMHQ